MRCAAALLPVSLLVMAAATTARAADGAAAATLPTGEDARPQGLPVVPSPDPLPAPQPLEKGGYRTVSLSPGVLALSSRFGWRSDPLDGGTRFHAGVDIPARAGAAVRAVRAGRVVYAGWAGGYGNLVVIDHGAGLRSRYGHLERVLVAAGDPVGTGERIGEVGSTGRSTGPHLHYEVRMGGVAVDPTRAAMRVPSALLSDPAWPAIETGATEVAPRWSWTTGGMADALPAPAIR